MYPKAFLSRILSTRLSDMYAYENFAGIKFPKFRGFSIELRIFVSAKINSRFKINSENLLHALRLPNLTETRILRPSSLHSQSLGKCHNNQ